VLVFAPSRKRTCFCPQMPFVPIRTDSELQVESRSRECRNICVNGADGISDIEHVASEGMERFGERDIEGKAAMGRGE
jgi:hypothetical protein